MSGTPQSSIIFFPPRKETAIGAAIVFAPGAGHCELWTDDAGYDVAQWLRADGITAFVLRYRIAREEGSTYTSIVSINAASWALTRRAWAAIRLLLGKLTRNGTLPE